MCDSIQKKVVKEEKENKELVENNSKILDLNSIILIATLNINNLKHKSQRLTDWIGNKIQLGGVYFLQIKAKVRQIRKELHGKTNFFKRISIF